MQVTIKGSTDRKENGRKQACTHRQYYRDSAVMVPTELGMAKLFQTQWFYHFATSSKSHLGLSELRIVKVKTTEEPPGAVMLLITEH